MCNQQNGLSFPSHVLFSPIALYSKAPNPEKRADGRSKAMSESSVNSSTSSGVAPPPVPLLLWLQCFFFALLAGGKEKEGKDCWILSPLPFLPTSVTVGSWGLLDNGGREKEIAAGIMTKERERAGNWPLLPSLLCGRRLRPFVSPGCREEKRPLLTIKESRVPFPSFALLLPSP